MCVSWQELKHPNIVRYLDVFEIDHDSFATVLEYCKGTDLDRRLKEEGPLSEREARAVVMQVLAALCHMTGCDAASKKDAVRVSDARDPRSRRPPHPSRLIGWLAFVFS